MIRVVALLSVLVLARLAAADDTKPPSIRHVPVVKAQKGDSVTIAADMTDESEIFAPMLNYRYPGAKAYTAMPLTRRAGNTYAALVPATADIEYWLEAYDEFGNGPARDGSAEKPYRIVVAEKAKPAPVAVRPAPVREAAPEPAPAPEPEPVPEAVTEAPPPEPAYTEPPVMPEPVYRRWWFIGGSAVVATAVVVGLVVALQPDPVYRNTLSATFKRPAER